MTVLVEVKLEEKTTSVSVESIVKKQESIVKSQILNQIQVIVSNGSLGNISIETNHTVCQIDITTEDCITVEVVSSLKLDETFSEDLNDNTSTKFKQLEKEFCEEVIVVFNF